MSEIKKIFYKISSDKRFLPTVSAMLGGGFDFIRGFANYDLPQMSQPPETAGDLLAVMIKSAMRCDIPGLITSLSPRPLSMPVEVAQNYDYCINNFANGFSLIRPTIIAIVLLGGFIAGSGIVHMTNELRKK